MTVATCLYIVLALFLIELLYFKIALHFQIIDQPNHRSSHQFVAIRGGGVIFTIAALIFFALNQFQYPWFMLGLVLITFISFLDDVFTLKSRFRLTIHLLAVLLFALSINLLQLPWYWIAFALFFIIGTINAYNFMDGINGITGGYSLLLIATMYYINNNVISFTNDALLITIALSLLVFNFFNFRIKAKCFAGDVGSVSISFLLLFFLAQLILKTHNFNYIMLFVLYGLDVVSTMMFRLIRREDVFEAHRSHFYQYLVNTCKIPHLLVAIGYMILQFGINLLLIFVVKDSATLGLILVCTAIVVFLSVRFMLEGAKSLLGKEKVDSSIL